MDQRRHGGAGDPLTEGTTIGPYAVVGLIGQGGMGEVYQARDMKLDRDVALKVLPEAFTSVQRRESTLVMLGNAGGLIEPLRDDPRFADLARQLSVGGF